MIVPKSALGQPAAGWVFTVVLTGQDGFSRDQARGFAPTPQPFLFGVCAPGGTSPICAADPATVPKAVDTMTPAGISQGARQRITDLFCENLRRYLAGEELLNIVDKRAGY